MTGETRSLRSAGRKAAVSVGAADAADAADAAGRAAAGPAPTAVAVAVAVVAALLARIAADGVAARWQAAGVAMYAAGVAAGRAEDATGCDGRVRRSFPHTPTRQGIANRCDAATMPGPMTIIHTN